MKRIVTYLILDTPYVKIGKTTIGVHRRWSLSKNNTLRTTDNPRILTFLGEIDGDWEQFLHEQFKHIHAQGEWFHDCLEIREGFAKAQKIGRAHAQALAEDRARTREAKVRRAGPVQPLCVDVRRAAEMLGVSEETVHRYIDEGRLPAVRFPGVRSGPRLAVEDLSRIWVYGPSKK